FWWTGVGVFVLWNVFTVVGAVVGDALGDPARWGLDAAAAAAFLGLLWPRMASRTAQLVAAGAVVVALVLTPVVPAGLPVLAAAAGAVLVGSREPRHALRGRAEQDRTQQDRTQQDRTEQDRKDVPDGARPSTEEGR